MRLLKKKKKKKKSLHEASTLTGPDVLSVTCQEDRLMRLLFGW